ncbi:MAG: hypothetical protein WBE38_20745 [Terracidiphilus sp.]
MTDIGTGGGASREDIVQRIELMASMVAEGRRFTARCGWIFLLWGVVDLAASSWRFFEPDSHWVGAWSWPICLIAGTVATLIGLAITRRDPNQGKNTWCRYVEAVWGMMGISLAIYVGSAMARHLTWQNSYIAGLLVIVGMAHAISAAILRWRVQGVMAGIWWAGGIAAIFARSRGEVDLIMFLEMGLGMVLFGLYTMMLGRRNGGGWVSKNA